MNALEIIQSHCRIHVKFINYTQAMKDKSVKIESCTIESDLGEIDRTISNFYNGDTIKIIDIHILHNPCEDILL